MLERKDEGSTVSGQNIGLLSAEEVARRGDYLKKKRHCWRERKKIEENGIV